MRVFLAGASGVIGRRLLPLLVQAGHEVWGMTRHAAKAELLTGLGARPVIMNALDRSAVMGVVGRVRPDVILHQLTDLGARDFAANSRLRIEGTRNLVDAALAAGVRRMVAQSLAFVYAPGPGPADESEPLDLDAAQPARRNTVAGVAALERAVAELPEGVVLRYGILYGPGTWYAVDGAFADEVRLGKVQAGADVTSFLHVEDAARAAVAALAWPAGPVNIVDDEPAPALDWLPVFAAAAQAPPPAVSEAHEPWARGASNARARQQFHWQPIWPNWRQGFQSGLV